MSKQANKNGSITNMALTNLISDLVRLPLGYKGKNQLPDSYMAKLKLKDAKARSAKRSTSASLRPAGRTSVLEVPSAFGTSSDSLIRSSIISSSANASVMRGTTLLGAVTNGVTSTGAQAVFSCSSNPVTFPDRMGLMAQTFDKYVYKKCTLRYVPACSTSTNGLIIIAIDRDYMDPPSTASLSQTMSYEAVASGSAFASHKCSIARDTHERRDYYTNFTASTELRESEQFRFWVYSAGVASNLTIGYMYLDYEIEMISPVYAPTEINANPAAIAMAQATVNITYTTLSSLPTITFTSLPYVFPVVSLAVGAIFEVLLTTSINPTGLTVGSGSSSPSWSPQTSQLIYIRPSRNNDGYNVFLDYPSALANVSQNNALYNPLLVSVVMCNASRCTVRQIQGTNAAS